MPTPAPADSLPAHLLTSRSRRGSSRLGTRWLVVVALAAGTVGTGPPAGRPDPATAVGSGYRLAAVTDDRSDELDHEGGTARLREQLDEASRGYLDARTALDRSMKRQRQLDERLAALTAEITARDAVVHQLADRAYRSGRLVPVSVLLDSASPRDFLVRVTTLSSVAIREDEQLRQLLDARQEQQRARAGIDEEIRQQHRQLQAMAKRKQQAERALALAGGKGDSPGVPSTTAGARGGPATAAPAPRNRDGSWPRESCRVDDPTTSGCVTPRTLHALRQAKAAGFTRYVSCHRRGGPGEHPKGRACDFAAQRGGFGGRATGGDRAYGNQLTGFLIRNADRLGVLYVIWYRQIWLPSSGWKAYHGTGSPAREHTNHVHLSVY